MGFEWDTFLDNTPYPLEAVNLKLGYGGGHTNDGSRISPPVRFWNTPRSLSVVRIEEWPQRQLDL
jgi:hypothetical protein